MPKCPTFGFLDDGFVPLALRGHVPGSPEGEKGGGLVHVPNIPRCGVWEATLSLSQQFWMVAVHLDTSPARLRGPGAREPDSDCRVRKVWASPALEFTFSPLRSEAIASG